MRYYTIYGIKSKQGEEENNKLKLQQPAWIEKKRSFIFKQ